MVKVVACRGDCMPARGHLLVSRRLWRDRCLPTPSFSSLHERPGCFSQCVIFNNIRRFLVYLLSCNISEVMIVALAVLAGLPLPILPLQILFLNLVTDVFPAFALATGEGEEDVLHRPPRNPREPLLGRLQWLFIGGSAVLLTAATLGALLMGHQWLGLEGDALVTLSFLTLAFTQLWHVFNMRGAHSGLLRNMIARNPSVWMAIAFCTAILLTAVYWPPLASPFISSRRAERPGV